MTCFSSGNRSRTIARRIFPRKPVVPSRSIVLSVKASIAEISPVPWRGGGSPDSYSPRTAFHLHVVRDFINDSWFRPIGLTFAPLIDSWFRPIRLTFAPLIEPWLSKGTEGVLLKIRPVRGSANASQRRSSGAGGSDSLLQDVQQQRASARLPNYLKTRRTVRGRYFPPQHTHECSALFHFLQAAAGERGPLRCGS